MKAQRGFTLIEILVVILIISIVTSVGVLSISRNDNKQVERFAREVAQLVMFAEQQAMLKPTILGLHLDEAAYEFSSLHTEQGGIKQRWVPLQDAILKRRTFPDGIEMYVDVKQSRQRKQSDEKIYLPEVVISSNGDLTPFTLYIGRKGERPRYAIIGDVSGQITSKALS